MNGRDGMIAVPVQQPDTDMITISHALLELRLEQAASTDPSTSDTARSWLETVLDTHTLTSDQRERIKACFAQTEPKPPFPMIGL